MVTNVSENKDTTAPPRNLSQNTEFYGRSKGSNRNIFLPGHILLTTGGWGYCEKDLALTEDKEREVKENRSK